MAVGKNARISSDRLRYASIYGKAIASLWPKPRERLYEYMFQKYQRT